MTSISVSRPRLNSALAKRCYDLTLASAGLLVLSPLFLLIAALIKLTDGGKVFYRQPRIGQHGRPFHICKFRTMIPNAERMGGLLTPDRDTRITRVGAFLRKTKLDELPQLWNVWKGEMSLVGPRPEVPRYVEHYTSEQRQILQYQPGITDLASLYFRNEGMLLCNAPDVERFYLEHCMARKLALNQRYAQRANLLSDTWIIVQTVCPYWSVLLLIYAGVLTLALWLGTVLVPDASAQHLAPTKSVIPALVVVSLQLACLFWRRQCHGLLSYFSVPELLQLTRALACSTALLWTVGWVTHGKWLAPNVVLIDALLAMVLLGGLRLILRLWRERCENAEQEPDRPSVRVGIIGAGDVGSRLAREFLTKNLRRKVVAFFDDDPQKWHKRIHEIPVIGMPECLLNDWAGELDEVLIAVADSSSKRFGELTRALQKNHVKVQLAQTQIPSEGPELPARASDSKGVEPQVIYDEVY